MKTRFFVISESEHADSINGLEKYYETAELAKDLINAIELADEMINNGECVTEIRCFKEDNKNHFSICRDESGQWAIIYYYFFDFDEDGEIFQKRIILYP